MVLKKSRLNKKQTTPLQNPMLFAFNKDVQCKMHVKIWLDWQNEKQSLSLIWISTLLP